MVWVLLGCILCRCCLILVNLWWLLCIGLVSCLSFLSVELLLSCWILGMLWFFLRLVSGMRLLVLCILW